MIGGQYHKTQKTEFPVSLIPKTTVSVYVLSIGNQRFEFTGTEETLDESLCEIFDRTEYAGKDIVSGIWYPEVPGKVYSLSLFESPESFHEHCGMSSGAIATLLKTIVLD